jgi:hypothetical protein
MVQCDPFASRSNFIYLSYAAGNGNPPELQELIRYMKIDHNELVYKGNPEGRSFDELKRAFKDAYQIYRELRERVYREDEATEPDSSSEELQAQFADTKNLLSSTILDVYRQSASLDEFEGHLKDILSYSGNVPPEDLEEYALGAYIYPPSLKDGQTHSPIEAIYSTYENLRIIGEFLEVGERHSDAILLSGTNAWGAFHAVKGKIPSQLVDIGVEQRDYSEMSDIDFLITARNIEELEIVFRDYIEAGLIDQDEIKRLDAFKDLLQSDGVEVFSVRSHYKGVEESIHFMLEDTITKISNTSEERNEDGIGFVRTLRPNIPGNVKEHGGYLTGDLLNLTKKVFDLHLELLADKMSEKSLGYISRMPTGGFTEVDGRKTYSIGLLSFYLLIAPTILFDRNGRMHDATNQLKERVKTILGGSLPAYVPREERMDPRVLQQIKESFI